MDRFLDSVFLDNPVRDYFWVFGVIVFAILLKRLISKYIAILLCKLFQRAWPSFDQKKFVELIMQPMGTFLVVSISIIALYRLNYPDAFSFTIYQYPLQNVFISIGILIQVIAFTWLLMRFIDFIALVLEIRANKTQDQSDNQLIVFFRDFLKVIIGIIGILLMLKFVFGYNISSLLTGLSIVGAAIALALRESIENLIASFVIFFDKPFTTGDTVKVQNVTGIVERIGLRSTRIRSEQKTYVTVPNKQMVDTILDNHTLRTLQKNELWLHISLDSPSAKIEELMKRIRTYMQQVKEIDHSNVLFQDINIKAYTILVEFFVPAAYLSEFNRVRQELNLYALHQMEDLQLKIAGSGKEIAV